jgi:HlyD family secretion protein
MLARGLQYLWLMQPQDTQNMRLAAENDAPSQRSAGIRDTSATDVVVEPPSKRNRYYWIGGGAGALILLMVLVYPVFNRWLQAEVTVPLERLRIATVERGDFVRDVGVQGTVVAAISPTLFSPAQGTVTLLVQAGDTVEAGDVLATVESPNLTSQLQQEQATLQSVKTEIDRQRIELKRRRLENQQTIDLARVKITAAEREQRRAAAAHEARAISLQDYEKANDDVDTARLEFTHAQQNAELEIEVMDFELRTDELAVDRQELLVGNLQRRVDELSIKSPVTGMVGSLMIDQKSAVAENQPLLTVVDLSAFEVEMRVPESYGDDLKLGMAAEISYGGRSFEAVVTAVSPEVRNNQVTGRVRFAAEPPAGLRQNQRVSVRIVLEASEDVLMVQRGPFLDSGGGRVAYVLNDGLAERRAIQVGASSISSLEIVSGLEEGEQIVISSIGQFNGANTVYVTD